MLDYAIPTIQWEPKPKWNHWANLLQLHTYYLITDFWRAEGEGMSRNGYIMI